jgi:hypothetical protein
MPAIHDLSFAAARGVGGGNPLLANRVGRITRDQRRSIRRFRRGRMGRALVRTAVLGGTAALIGRAEYPSLRDVRLVTLALLVLVLVNTAGRAYLLWHVVESDLAAGRVRELDGEFVNQAGDRVTFRVWDQRKRLTLYAAPVDPLRRGVLYRVYMLPRSGLLLGVEPRQDKA